MSSPVSEKLKVCKVSQVRSGQVDTLKLITNVGWASCLEIVIKSLNYIIKSTEEESEEEAPPPKKTAAKATPAKAKAAPAKAEESDDDDDGKTLSIVLLNAEKWCIWCLRSVKLDENNLQWPCKIFLWSILCAMTNLNWL